MTFLQLILISLTYINYQSHKPGTLCKHNSLLSFFLRCRTSLTNVRGRRTFGQLNATCQFPFTVGDQTFYTCTWYKSKKTGNSPWCSIETDDNNKHRGGKPVIGENGEKKKFLGICDDYDACTIPPRCKFEY